MKWTHIETYSNLNSELTRKMQSRKIVMTVLMPIRLISISIYTSKACVMLNLSSNPFASTFDAKDTRWIFEANKND